jgi:hypothetical protein
VLKESPKAVMPRHSNWKALDMTRTLVNCDGTSFVNFNCSKQSLNILKFDSSLKIQKLGTLNGIFDIGWSDLPEVLFVIKGSLEEGLYFCFLTLDQG